MLRSNLRSSTVVVFVLIRSQLLKFFGLGFGKTEILSCIAIEGEDESELFYGNNTNHLDCASSEHSCETCAPKR